MPIEDFHALVTIGTTGFVAGTVRPRPALWHIAILCEGTVPNFERTVHLRLYYEDAPNEHREYKFGHFDVTNSTIYPVNAEGYRTYFCVRFHNNTEVMSFVMEVNKDDFRYISTILTKATRNGIIPPERQSGRPIPSPTQVTSTKWNWKGYRDSHG